MALFLWFYGVDPIDWTYGRFVSNYNLIREVQGEFEPKEPIQMGLMMREEEIRQEREELKRRKKAMQ